MKKNIGILILSLVLIGFWTGCKKSSNLIPPSSSGSQGPSASDPDPYEDVAPRMVVSGTVTNEDGEALEGIYIVLDGIREPDEPDIAFYNYAWTDSIGKYTIIRYRGRECPDEVTVIAIDPENIYKEQVQNCSVTYNMGEHDDWDPEDWESEKAEYDAFVFADFILEKK